MLIDRDPFVSFIPGRFPFSFEAKVCGVKASKVIDLGTLALSRVSILLSTERARHEVLALWVDWHDLYTFTGSAVVARISISKHTNHALYWPFSG